MGKLTEVQCQICQQGSLDLFPNESGRCPICNAWLRNGEITETPDAG